MRSTPVAKIVSHWATPALSYLVLGLLLRLPAFFMSVVDWDESLYLLIASDVLDGDLPYVRTWDHKQPGIFYVFALAMGLLGKSVLSIRVLGWLCVSGGAWVLHRLATRWWPLPGVGWLAGVFYLVLTSINGGQATNTEIVFGACTVLAFLLSDVALGHTGRTRRPWLWAAGAAAGAAFSIKLVALFDLAGLALFYAVGLHAGERPGARRWWRAFWVDGAHILLAFLVVNVLFLMPHLMSGQADLLYQAVIEYNLTYGKAESSVGRVAMGVYALMPLWIGLLIALASIGLRDQLPDRTCRLRLGSSWVWLGLSLLSVILQRKLFPHHFLQIAPPASLLFGLGAALIAAPLYRQRARAGTVVLLVLLSAGVTHAMARLQYDHQRLLRATLHGDVREFDLPTQLARRILAASGPGASLYVYNDQPILYHLIGTHPPTRFPFPLHLARTDRPIPGLDRAAEFARILASEPEWIVARDSQIPLRFGEALRDELSRHYTEYGTFPVTTRNEQHFFGLLYRAAPTGELVRLYRRTRP